MEHARSRAASVNVRPRPPVALARLMINDYPIVPRRGDL